MSSYRLYLCLYTLQVAFFYVPSANYHSNQNISISQILLASKLNMFRYFILMFYVIIESSNLLRVSTGIIFPQINSIVPGNCD